MNICAVISRAYNDAVESAVIKTGNILLDVCVEGLDHRDAASAINMQINGRPDILIIDAGVELQFPWNSIYRVRIGTPDTRIIILCEDETNSLLTKCVQAGIYDILIVSEPRFLSSQIEAAITHPANYAAATRYINVPDENTRNAPKIVLAHKVGEEVHIVEEKPVGNVTIAIASVLPRSGCTTTAINIARYMAGKGLRVALWMSNINHFTAIQEAYNDVEVTTSGSRYTLDKIDFCAGMEIPDIGEYQYIILDIGCMSPETIKEFKRSTVKIVLSGVKDWELPVLEKFLADGLSNNEPISSYIYGFVHTDQATFDDLEKSMKKMKCIHVPVIYDPFKQSEEMDKLIDPILSQYLPGLRPQKPSGRGLWSFFKGK
jgi:hypothetical protein